MSDPSRTSRQLESPWLAFLDESGSDRGRDPDTYILSAVVVDRSNLPDVRKSMISLKLPGQRKLHWREENDARRLAIVKTMAELPIEHYVAVHDGHPDEINERRRHLCMETLLFELDQLGVGQLTFESRGRADDRRDRNLLDALRAAHTVGPGLRIDHQAGPAESALWAADATCGVIVRDRVGDSTYRTLIDTRLTIYQAR